MEKFTHLPVECTTNLLGVTPNLGYKIEVCFGPETSYHGYGIVSGFERVMNKLGFDQLYVCTLEEYSDGRTQENRYPLTNFVTGKFGIVKFQHDLPIREDNKGKSNPDQKGGECMTERLNMNGVTVEPVVNSTPYGERDYRVIRKPQTHSMSPADASNRPTRLRRHEIKKAFKEGMLEIR